MMEEQIRQTRQRSILWGVLGSALLLGIYFAIVSVANSFAHALEEFAQLWYWIGTLTVGFGVQVGLYAHVRQTFHLKEQSRAAASSLAAGGGFSTVSMVACCAHHLTDLLPLMGLAAAAAFLTHYQLIFILIGVVSNLLGLTYMLSIIARHRLYFASNHWLAWLATFDYRRVFQVEIPALAVVLVAGSLFLYRPAKGASTEAPVEKQVEQTVILESREVAGNGVWVEVQGQYDRQGRTVDFAVKFTTHSGSLDLQVEKIASLRIDDRERKLPVSWEGAPPGGHHRSGKLHYEQLPAETGTIALTLSADGRLGVRRFAWDVQSPQTRRENHGTGSRM